MYETIKNGIKDHYQDTKKVLGNKTSAIYHTTLGAVVLLGLINSGAMIKDVYDGKKQESKVEQKVNRGTHPFNKDLSNWVLSR